MKREWLKFRNENSRNHKKYYSDCQVVTAVNAYYFLTGNIIKKSSYFDLCELAGACYGSAISIEKVHKKLDLETFDYTNHFDEVEIEYPIEMKVWHPRYGFHSTLIIDYEIKCKALQITNFKYATTVGGWLWEEDLNFYTRDCNEGWIFRKFKRRSE
ncbi:MAG: hypothetical protein ACFFG0_01005 [Candidatus Thorarchaeota archaeon]